MTPELNGSHSIKITLISVIIVVCHMEQFY